MSTLARGNGEENPSWGMIHLGTDTMKRARLLKKRRNFDRLGPDRVWIHGTHRLLNSPDDSDLLVAVLI